MRTSVPGLIIAAAAAAQWREAKPEGIRALFRADVRQVRVDVEVTGGMRPLTRLTRESFVVRDNGAVQRLAGFAREEIPPGLALVIDVSGSMRDSVEQGGRAASEAFRVLRKEGRASVMVFHSRPEMALELTGDLGEVERPRNGRVLATGLGGGTHIMKAALESGRRCLGQPHAGRRRAVLMITDTQGRKAGPNGDQVAGTLWEADTTLSALVADAGGERARRAAGRVASPGSICLDWALRATVNQIVERTGGSVVWADDVRRDFPALVERLRNRYSSCCAMPKAPPGERRRVTVELAPEARRANSRAEVTARRVYRTPTEESTP